MKPKISLITLSVDDLDSATRFYAAGLGLPRYDFEGEGVAFFSLEGTWLALYPRAELARDIGIAGAERPAPASVTLAHNAPSREDVEEVAFNPFLDLT